MGLDMYAYTTEAKPARDVDFEIDFDSEGAATKIHQWRKHPNLHGWMHDLYDAKGGSEVFNCVNLRLRSDDLEALKAAITATALPATDGFFFGASDGSEIDDDLAFIAKAEAAIAQGLTVFYRAWW